MLDPYNPTGSTAHVNFNTSKTLRWQTDARRCHVNWAILDSDWEGEFCRVVEKHPKVRSYVKNHNLGLEVPYRFGSENRKYRPDFIVRVDDGHGDDDLLNLVVEIKGYRGEDAVVKKTTMDTYWVPGVNHLRTYGRWAFVELKDVYKMESDFAAKIDERVRQDDRARLIALEPAEWIDMARKTKGKSGEPKTVETLTHEEAKRKNIPTAEYQSVCRRKRRIRSGRL